MATPLPKWIMKHYSTLWKKFGNKEFNHEKAHKTIENKKMVSLILSELRKSGWLNIKLDPKDSRKRIYRLENPEKIVKDIK